MESSRLESRSLFKRLLAYHCYRDGHRQPSETASYLSKVYGKCFLTTPTVRRLYRLFEKPGFDFDEICCLDYRTTTDESTGDQEKPVKRSKRRNVKKKGNHLEGEKVEEENDDFDQTFENQENLEANTEEIIDELKPNSDDDYDPSSSSDDPSTEPFSVKERSKKKKPSINKRDKHRKMPAYVKPFLEPGPSLPLDPPEHSGLPGKKNIKRRQLYLHCYEAKYSAAEAARYLNTVYGEAFATKTSISGWYRKFKQSDYSLVDKPRSGRRSAMKDCDLDAYMQANPQSTVPKLCEHFKVHRKTMMRGLHRLNYRFVIDQWLKIEDKAEITDSALCEYKLHHADASVREIAEHFRINRAIVARRLRGLGFSIPKWPTWPKKKLDPSTGELVSVSKPLKPGETYIKRKAPPRKPKGISPGGAQTDAQAAGQVPGEPQQAFPGLASHTVTQILTPLDANPDLTGLTSPRQPIVISGPTVVNGTPGTAGPGTEVSPFSNLLQLATTSAVNSLLPAVLRHKSSNSFSSQNQTGPQGPVVPQQTNVIVGPMSSAPSEHSQTTQSPYVQAITVNPGQSQFINGSNQQQQQQTTQGQQATPTSQQQQQQQGEDILMQAVFNTFDPPLDNVQVQSILHPYYM